MTNKELRVVVFDLDETLGYFQQFGLFCNSIEAMKKKKLTEKEFMYLLNLYPEYFRPYLFEIMNFLKQKKINKELDKVCIYTNNNAPKQWAKRIFKFIEKKINYELFDSHIGAYKVNGVQIEKKRTTHNKTLTDFFMTTKIPTHSKICFIDDLYHPEMDKKNVVYIKVQPYSIELPITTLTSRFCNNFNCNIPFYEFNNAITSFFKMNTMIGGHESKAMTINHVANGEKIITELMRFFT